MNNSFKTSPKPVVSFSTRNAFVTNSFVKMRGIFLGVNYADITRVGITFNWLAKGFEKDHLLVVDDTTSLNIQKGLRMYYIAPKAEYCFYRSAHWEAGIFVQLGLGNSSFKFKSNDESFVIQKDWIALYEPGMTIQYRFLKYFGVGAGVGYRLMLKNNKHISERFTSPIYTFGLKVFFSDVYKDYFSDVDNH